MSALPDPLLPTRALSEPIRLWDATNPLQLEEKLHQVPFIIS